MMMEGLFFVSEISEGMICRLVIDVNTVFSTTLLEWVAGRATFENLPMDVLEAYMEALVYRAESGVNNGITARATSAVLPFLGGVLNGTQLPVLTSLIAGDEVQYHTVVGDYDIDMIGYTAYNFPVLDVGGFQASLLECTSVIVTLRRRTAELLPWTPPEGYNWIVLPESEDYRLYYPTQWASTGEVLTISEYWGYDQLLARAVLLVNKAGVVSVEPLPEWHYTLQDDKTYVLSGELLSNGKLCYWLSNSYREGDNPVDCVPFFSAAYPLSVSPYTRQELPLSHRRIVAGFGRGYGFPAARISPQGQTYIVPASRLFEPTTIKPYGGIGVCVVAMAIGAFLVTKRG